MPSDEAILLYATYKLFRRSIRVLHRQECPGSELLLPPGDGGSDRIVELTCRRHGYGRIKMIIDERSGERQDRSLNAFSFHSINLSRQIKKRFVQSKVYPANIDIDKLVLLTLDPYLEVRTRFDELEKCRRHKMSVNIGNHGHNPR